MKKSAFTLAEVLITLGVIGVVSAITLPIIHSKIQNYVLKNRFKKVYNTYYSAIQMIYTENGYNFDCAYGDNFNWSGCPNFFRELAKNLKYTKYCQNNALSNGCIPKYTKYYRIDGLDCLGFQEQSINTKSRAWILNDGSIMFTYTNGNAPLFAVDINGFSKPNKGGYDLFVFNIINQGNALKLDGTNCSDSFKDTGGKTVREKLMN